MIKFEGRKMAKNGKIWQNMAKNSKLTFAI